MKMVLYSRALRASGVLGVMSLDTSYCSEKSQRENQEPPEYRTIFAMQAVSRTIREIRFLRRAFEECTGPLPSKKSLYAPAGA